MSLAPPPAPPPKFPVAAASEPLRTIAAAGALGFASCATAVFAWIGDGAFFSFVGVTTTILAWLWLRLGTRTAANSPDEKIRFEKVAPVGRLALGALFFGLVNGGLAGAAMLAASNKSDPLVWRLFGGLLLGTTFGAVVWFPAAVAAFLVYGLPLSWASSKMIARRADDVDRALRAAHLALAVPATIAGLLLTSAIAAAPEHRPIDAFHIAVSGGLALAALVVPLVFAARAHRRLTARTRLLAEALAGAAHVRLERLPADHRRGGELAVGPGVVPTHVLVRVAPGDGGYRVAAERREEIALFCEGASDDPAERGARRV